MNSKSSRKNTARKHRHDNNKVIGVNIAKAVVKMSDKKQFIIDQITGRNGFIKSLVSFSCPICRKDLRMVYISDVVLVCDTCKEVFLLGLRKKKGFNYEKIIEDGWA